MSLQTFWHNLRNAIFLLASAYGPMPSDSQDGRMTVQYGLDPAHANLSARRAKEKGLLTSGMSGPPGSGSSASAALTLSLESKLQVRTGELGSTLYRLTWRSKDTPSGRRLPWLAASVRRTKDNDCTGWPTCRQADALAGPDYAIVNRESSGGGSLPTAVYTAAWPTPVVNDMTGSTYCRGRQGEKILELPGATALAAWPTTRQADGEKNIRTLEGALKEIKRKGGPQDLMSASSLAAWQTLKASDGVFTTPRTTGPARLTVDGVLLIGSSAEMESGGPLNPNHSRWLMELPPVWCDCAVTAMQSPYLKRGRLLKRT